MQSSAKGLPLAAPGDEQSNSAVAGKPLETSGVGLTEGLKQSLNISPTVRTQHALELKSLHLANTLTAISWSQI